MAITDFIGKTLGDPGPSREGCVGVPLEVFGGFPGHILTLLPKPVLYVTLNHLVEMLIVVYF